MTDKPVGNQMPVEAKITPDQAVAIATAFAQSQGVAVASCGGVSYASDAEFLREVGHAPGYGTYIVLLLKDTFFEGNRHWQTGELLPDGAMSVQVNDQTGEAERFHQLL